jgi:hypothetical protein
MMTQPKSTRTDNVPYSVAIGTAGLAKQLPRMPSLVEGERFDDQ